MRLTLEQQASLDRTAKLDELNRRWLASSSQTERWQIIREAYRIVTPLILKGRIDPYFLDWTCHRTPIEELAWIDIRNAGLPLYPQYPASRYFLDFADPVQQIAVELDGAAYHSEARDRPRDESLLAQGWRTFRIPGKRSLPSKVDIREILAGCQNEADAVYELAQWGYAWSEGFFWALGFLFYRKPAFPGLSRPASREAAVRILSYHQLVEFTLDEDDE